MVMSLLQHEFPRDAFSELACFRMGLYACLTGRRDALFELGDAILCADGPVRTLGEDIGRTLPGAGRCRGRPS